MSDYIQDPNNPKKQIPGPKPVDAGQSSVTPPLCTYAKGCNYVILTSDSRREEDDKIGLFYGTSASFAELGGADGADAVGKSTSTNYDIYTLSSGTQILPVNATAWSGSLAAQASGSVKFVYQGGLDGMRR